MKIAVITGNVGGFDKIFSPVLQDIEYDLYSYDETNLPKPLVNLSNRLKAKYLKLQTHHFLPQYDIYIWLDSRVEIISKEFVREFVDNLKNRDLVILNHPDRKSVHEEFNFLLEKIKEGKDYICDRYQDQQIEKEIEFYNEINFDTKRKVLYAGGIFARWNNEETNRCFDEWWKLTIEFSHFDQGSLVFVTNKHDLKVTALPWNDVMGNLLNIGKHKMNQINLGTEDTHTIIKDYLRRKAPLAVIRYGDGEAMLLDPDLDGSREYKNHVFKRQLGNDTSNEEKKEIINNLTLAYQDADIIGIPTARHERKEGYWQKAIPILNEKIKGKKDCFCSIDLHYDFLNNEIFDRLLTNRENLFYISSSNLDEQFKKRFNIKNVYSYIISPEMKFSPDYQGIKHYPDHFNKVRDWIDNIGIRGELCLVGAGVVGKIYNIWIKERGGVSIDVGSVFDNWAGKLTRGVDRGANIEDNTHKL